MQGGTGETTGCAGSSQIRKGAGHQRGYFRQCSINPAGRLVYRCRTVIHMRSRSDMEAGEYNVRLTTLYNPSQQQSYIRDEVARRHALRYVRVPERTVNLFPAAAEKSCTS